MEERLRSTAKHADFRTPTGGGSCGWLVADNGGVLLRVRLQPGARRTGIAGEHGGRLKIAVTAPPLDGRANEALCGWLADRMNLPVRSVRIVAGQHSREKTLHLAGVAADQVLLALGPK
jgi:uncharacterized protein (TIGR00251 family)